MSVKDEPVITAVATKSRKKPDLSGLPVVAWMGEDYEGRGAIVWHKTRGQARKAAAAELDCEFQDVVSLRRYPQLDGFTGNLVRYQLAHGWRWECQKCQMPCYGQDADAELDPAITTVIDDNDHVFCCIEHCREYEAYWGMHRKIDAAILEDFKKQYLGPLYWFPEDGYFVPGHNEWLGWVDTPKGRVTVWEFVSIHQQSFFVPRHLEHGAAP